jgi:hypothetical protein
MSKSSKPSLKIIFADAKARHLKVKKSVMTINGRQAFEVEGHGLFTRRALTNIFGLGAVAPTLTDKLDIHRDADVVDAEFTG